MSFDLAQDEIRQRLQSMPGATAVEPGAFDGFLRGTGMTAMRTFAQAGRALDLAANAPGLAFAQLTGRYDAIDRYFREREDGTQRAVDYWTPKPGEVGVAGEVVGTLLATIPLVVANAPLAVGQFGLSLGEEATRKGASGAQGAGVATVMGAGFGLGVWLPMLGGTLLQRAGIGAGANVGQGIAMRGAAGKIVEGTPAAELFHALDPTEITIDLILGLAFGGAAHYLPSWRRQSESANKQFLEGVEQLRTWAQNLKPSDIDALATLRMAQHKNADSIGGTPVGPEDVEAHVSRVNRALEQATADQPIDVQDLPAARIEPFLAKAGEVDPRIDDANRMMSDFEAEAFRIADEEGLRPTVPMEQRPAYRAVREALETIDQAGKLGAEPIDAYAKTVNAFFEATARRTGKPIEELMAKYLPKITGEAPVGVALEQEIIVDGTMRQARDSTGRPVAQDAAGIKAFWKWAGDTALVDVNGKPLVFYHGTSDDIEAFDLNHPNRKDTGWLGTGVYMTSSPTLAGSYALMKGGGAGQNIVPLYGRLENPYHATQADKDGFMLVAHNKGREAARALADKWTQELQAKGHDGVILEYTAEHVGEANASTEVVIFDPAGVKSAIGNRGTFDQNDPNILRQDQQPGWFYSELGRQVEAANMKAAPAKGWRDWLRGLTQKGSIKAEEVKWSGLEEWIAAQPGRVTKEEVQAFLEQGGVKVEEVMLGTDSVAREAQLRLQAAEQAVVEQARREYFDSSGARDYALDAARGELSEGQLKLMSDEMRPLVEALQRAYHERQDEIAPPKFGDRNLQLPGGQNYRELLITLPEKGAGQSAEALDPLIRSLSHWPERPQVARLPENQARLDELNAEWDRRNNASVGTEARFTQSHFDQPNILSHVRFNERVDSDGKRVLFVEEIQSDWAQKGKKEGFRGDLTKLVAKREDGFWRIDTADGAFITNVIEDAGPITAEAAIVEAQRRIAGAPGQIARRIPVAPFVTKTDSWTALAVKRLIHYAATNGYDKVAWTRGEQQVERYTNALRQVVDAIEWEKTPEGIQLKGYKGKGGGEESARERELLRRAAIDDLPPEQLRELGVLNRERHQARNKVVDTKHREDELSDAIGKAMAERIIKDQAQSGSIEGENIRIDDTGMAGFYDKIVPKVVNETLKKLGGGKVGEVSMNAFNAPEVADPTARMVQPGFDITPDLRERAMKGMPLFQRTGDQPRGYFQMGEDGPRIGLLAAANRSTFLHESGHFFLEVTHDLAREANAPAELKADMQRLLDWFQVEPAKWDGMTLDEKRPYHEQFARGFERYLREGNAPTPELKTVFERFKEWLTEIYKSLKNLNVKISDDVRGVMDRMLGAETVAPPMPKPTVPFRVSLIDDITRLGGIRKDALLDITGESRTGRGVKGLPPGLFKEGGAGLDDLATQLRDQGWPIPEDDVDGGVQGLRDLIAKELGGETALKVDEDPNVLKPLAEQDAAAVFDRYAEMEAKLAEQHNFNDTPEYQAAVNRLRTQRDYELAAVLSGEGLHIEAEARHMTAENPDLEITIGENADGTPIRKTARELLDEADAEAREIEEQEPLMIEAAECIVGIG